MFLVALPGPALMSGLAYANGLLVTGLKAEEGRERFQTVINHYDFCVTLSDFHIVRSYIWAIKPISIKYKTSIQYKTYIDTENNKKVSCM